MNQLGAGIQIISHCRPPGAFNAHKKTPVAVKRKEFLRLTSLAVMFNVARNPVTNRHAVSLTPVQRVPPSTACQYLNLGFRKFTVTFLRTAFSAPDNIPDEAQCQCLRINAGKDGAELHGNRRPILVPVLTRGLQQSGPVILMVHGYKYEPLPSYGLPP